MGKELSVMTNVRNFLEKVAFNRDEAQSRARATEAAMRFAGQPNQEPGATFTSDSESRFDLNRLKPESVFRVRYDEEAIGRIDHRWFVIGDRKDKKIHIYEIVFGVADFENRTHAQLTLTPGFFVTQIEPHQLVFPVCEAHDALGGEKQDGLFPVRRIDVMSGGIRERVHETGGVGLQYIIQREQGVLAPIPVEVSRV